MKTTLLEKQSPFAFHQGEALIRLAGTYPTVLEGILEAVQNAIDSNATIIRININQKSRSLSVRDNGDGVTKDYLEQAFTSVCKSIKKRDRLGRYGLGMIAFLGKCDHFSFTSTPRSNPRHYLEWTLDTEDLQKQEEITGIPIHERRDLIYVENSATASRGLTGVDWRTQILVEGYTKDRFINRVSIDSLRGGILDKYSAVMRKRKILVSITLVDQEGKRDTSEVRASAYEGISLPEMVLENKESGKTYFNLCLAKKTGKGRIGKVQVGESGNDFRISMAMFLRSLPEELYPSEDTSRALLSGFFEGEILNNKVRFASHRRGFEVNEALAGFIISIDEWFKNTGLNYFEKAKEERREERYQELGLRSMRVMEGLLKDPSCSHFMRVIQSFTLGNIGSGHTNLKGELSDLTSTSIDGQEKKDRNDNSNDNGRNRHKPKKEKEAHHPFTVVGPQGRRRKVVKSSSLGLQLVHDVLETDKLWQLDMETGTLFVNIRHPLWVQCDECSDRVVMKFQEHIMIQALGLQIITDSDWREIASMALDELNPAYAFQLINGDNLAGRSPGRKKGS